MRNETKDGKKENVKKRQQRNIKRGDKEWNKRCGKRKWEKENFLKNDEKLN